MFCLHAIWNKIEMTSPNIPYVPNILFNFFPTKFWEVAKQNTYVKCNVFQNDSSVMVWKDPWIHIPPGLVTSLSINTNLFTNLLIEHKLIIKT